jgi:hypothetical protein
VYRGVAGALLGTLPTAMVYFAAYDLMKERLEAHYGEVRSHAAQRAAQRERPGIRAARARLTEACVSYVAMHAPSRMLQPPAGPPSPRPPHSGLESYRVPAPPRHRGAARASVRCLIALAAHRSGQRLCTWRARPLALWPLA